MPGLLPRTNKVDRMAKRAGGAAEERHRTAAPLTLATSNKRASRAAGKSTAGPPKKSGRLEKPKRIRMDMNSATAEQLAVVLTGRTAVLIAEELAANGPFTSWDELLERVRGMGVGKVKKLKDAGYFLPPAVAPPTVEDRPKTVTRGVYRLGAAAMRDDDPLRASLRSGAGHLGLRSFDTLPVGPRADISAGSAPGGPDIMRTMSTAAPASGSATGRGPRARSPTYQPVAVEAQEHELDLDHLAAAAAGGHRAGQSTPGPAAGFDSPQAQLENEPGLAYLATARFGTMAVQRAGIAGAHNPELTCKAEETIGEETNSGARRDPSRDPGACDPVSGMLGDMIGATVDFESFPSPNSPLKGQADYSDAFGVHEIE